MWSLVEGHQWVPPAVGGEVKHLDAGPLQLSLRLLQLPVAAIELGRGMHGVHIVSITARCRGSGRVGCSA
jgi:hypothetical protein